MAAGFPLACAIPVRVLGGVCPLSSPAGLEPCGFPHTAHRRRSLSEFCLPPLSRKGLGVDDDFRQDSKSELVRGLEGGDRLAELP